MRYRYALGCWLLVLALPPVGWGFDVKGSLNVTGSQSIAGPINYGTSATGTDDYAVTLSSAITAYTTGTCYSFAADVANEGVATLNLNSLGAVPIQKREGPVLVDLTDEDIRAGGEVQVCYNGTVMVCRTCHETQVASQLSGTTGIETSATTVQKLRPEVSVLSGNATLCRHHTVMATVGTGGANLTLPSAADNNCAGYLKVIIADTGTGFLTLTPSGTDLINDVNEPTVPIRGQRASQTCERTGDTGWLCQEMSRSGLGEIVTSTCTGANGSTNNSSSGSGAYVDHSLTCAFDAANIRTGTVIESCATFNVVTGSSAPDLYWDLLVNSTALVGNTTALVTLDNITGRKVTLCADTVIGLQSGSNWLAYSGIKANFSAVNSAVDASGTPVSVNVPTTGTLTFKFRTQWTAAGTGTNTIQQTNMTQRIAR